MSEIKRVTVIPGTLAANDILILKESETSSLLVVDKTATKAFRLGERVCLNGPSEIFHKQEGLWLIQSYSDRETYTCTSSDGLVWQDGEYVHFVVSNAALSTASFSVNERVFTIALMPVIVYPPEISAPTFNAVNVPVSGARVIASGFLLNDSLSLDDHASTDWEVSTDINFGSIVASSYTDKVNLIAWTIP